MKPKFWSIAALLLACSPAFAQEALVNQIENALHAAQGGPVLDFGHLLKPGGVRELKQRADAFRAEGMNVYFVTVPRGTANVPALAETVYRDLNGSPDDLLIVFDGQQVYGKTLALQGEPQAFRDALQEAKPAFKLYYAKGLAQFAQSLHDRIVQRRQGQAAAQQAAKRRGGRIWTAVLIVLLLAIGAIAYPRVKQAAVVRRQYNERLRTAEQTFDRITLNMPGHPPEDVNTEWVRLEDDLRRCRQRQGTTSTDLEKLIADLQAFDHRLPSSSAPDSRG